MTPALLVPCVQRKKENNPLMTESMIRPAMYQKGLLVLCTIAVLANGQVADLDGNQLLDAIDVSRASPAMTDAVLVGKTIHLRYMFATGC